MAGSGYGKGERRGGEGVQRRADDGAKTINVIHGMGQLWGEIENKTELLSRPPQAGSSLRVSACTTASPP
jgi:hypothetical protein